MKTLELRALLQGKKKEVIISEEMIEVFNFWKSKREEPKPLEIFYAGYILSNPMVRQEYQKQMRMNKDKI